MLSTIDLEQKMILLARPVCRAWYLGERIYGWERDPNRCQVPLSSHLYMFWTTDLIREELIECLNGYDEVMDFTLCSQLIGYTSFIPQLLGTLPIRDDTIVRAPAIHKPTEGWSSRRNQPSYVAGSSAGATSEAPPMATSNVVLGAILFPHDPMVSY